MSNAYPIYSNKDNKSDIRFYHCSKTIKNRKLKTVYPPGTILSSNQSVMFKPKFWLIDEIFKFPQFEYKYYKLHDCTTVNFYFMDNKWYMGSKNSWNISPLNDFIDVNYMDLFLESAAHYPEFSLDNLDRSKMHTIIFCNPRCHFLADKHRVFSYAPITGIDMAEETTEDDENHVTVCTNTGEMCITQAPMRATATALLYNNRKGCYSKNEKFAIAKVLITAFCSNGEEGVGDLFGFYYEHLKEAALDILAQVENLFNDFIEQNIILEHFEGVPVPDDLINISQDNSIYDRQFIKFLTSVYYSKYVK